MCSHFNFCIVLQLTRGKTSEEIQSIALISQSFTIMFKSNGNLKRRILSVNVYLFKEVSILKASIYYSFSLWEVTRVK